jgi:hypothetical protein
MLVYQRVALNLLPKCPMVGVRIVPIVRFPMALWHHWDDREAIPASRA